MLATLLVLSVLQFSPMDAPRLDAPEPRALSLLAPAAAAPTSYGLLSHEHDPGVPARSSSFSLARAFGQFFAGFGSQLLVGSAMWVVEAVLLFGVSVFTSAYSHGVETDFILGVGTRTMVLVNGAVLPLLSALPIWLIARIDREHSHSYLWTWLSGVATYAVYWAVQYSTPLRYGGLELILWPTHVGSWFFAALVQTVVVNLTKEERHDSAPSSPSLALLNVDGSRVSVGAPLPVLSSDASRPGRMMPMFSLAQGRF